MAWLVQKSGANLGQCQQLGANSPLLAALADFRSPPFFDLYVQPAGQAKTPIPVKYPLFP